MKEKKNHNPLAILVIILLIFLAVMAVLCCKLWMDKNAVEQEKEEIRLALDSLKLENEEIKDSADEADKLAKEYKTAYETLKEENEKATLAEEEAKRIAEQQAKDYQEEYNLLVSYILDDAALAENLGNQIISVWNNAIMKINDDETDKYTFSNGAFVSDFNDALRKLFSDDGFSQDMAQLSSRQQEVKEEMKKMVNPPDEFGNAYKALENLYNSYLIFTNIVLDCNGSLNSFSSDFSNADGDLLKLYHIAELYVE